jgi:hypothetical protein
MDVVASGDIPLIPKSSEAAWQTGIEKQNIKEQTFSCPIFMGRCDPF